MIKIVRKDSGITLIALVITIIVLLILAGVSINAVIGDGGILRQAQKSSTTQRLATYSEEFQMKRADEDIESYAESLKPSNSEIYAVGEEVRNYIPSLRDDDVGKVVIFEGKLVYTGEDLTETDKESAESLGYLNMSKSDYEYMQGLRFLEKAVKNHAEDGTKIGTPLGTGANPYVTIAGINYGLGWYKITNATELTSLGLTEEQQALLLGKEYSNNGYIVKYSSGAVQCITGKNMYAGLSNEIWKYTFNYRGEENGIVVSNLLSGVTKDSIKNDSQFGEFMPTHTYAESGTTPGVIENYYKDDYTYDEDGGAILTQTTNILNMPIDQTKPINQKFSINVTIKGGTTSQYNQLFSGPNDSGHWGGANICGLSDYVNRYIFRLEIDQGFLRCYTYKSSPYDEYSRYEKTEEGEAIVDINRYHNKYLNIQITSERAGKTNIYLNGVKAVEFDSGNNDFTYKYCVIGDLRSGRGAKYIGNVYNFALYGEILTEEEVAQNWNYVKNELGINEAGDKIN